MIFALSNAKNMISSAKKAFKSLARGTSKCQESQIFPSEEFPSPIEPALDPEAQSVSNDCCYNLQEILFLSENVSYSEFADISLGTVSSTTNQEISKSFESQKLAGKP